MLSIYSSSCKLYCAGSEESACCFVWVENGVVCLSPYMYDLMFYFTMFMSLCVDVMVMSSA